MKNRKIKFKVWSGTMWLDGYDAHIHAKHPDNEDIELVSPYPDSKNILCQYTGLKDRNGKEIYEGDILDFGGLKPIEILWRNSGFSSRLIPYEESDPVHLTQEGMSRFGEIIGNIYENPELAK